MVTIKYELNRKKRRHAVGAKNIESVATPVRGDVGTEYEKECEESEAV